MIRQQEAPPRDIQDLEVRILVLLPPEVEDMAYGDDEDLVKTRSSIRLNIYIRNV